MTNPKAPPHSKEMEYLVLGSCMDSINALNEAVSSLAVDDFYFKEHRIIFEVIVQFYNKDKAVTSVLLADELIKTGPLERVGGMANIYEMETVGRGASQNIEDYCKAVKDKSIYRHIMMVTHEIHNASFNEPNTACDFLFDSQKKLLDIDTESSNQSYKLVSDVINTPPYGDEPSYLRELKNRMEMAKSGNSVQGIKTGFPTLDDKLGGFCPGRLIIIAARPAMGKTSFLLSMSHHLYFNQKVPLAIFSMEMTNEELIHKLISIDSDVPLSLIHKATVKAEDLVMISSTLKKMSTGTFIIDDQPDISITAIRARARRMKQTHDVKVIFVDYLQLIRGSGSKISQESNQYKIAEISRQLKVIAMELGITVVALSQLNRKLEESKDKIPMLHHLRDSGSIEQDADQVLLLHRPEVIASEKELKTEPIKGIAHVYIAKNRHGPIGKFDCNFDNHTTQFTELYKK